MLEAIKEAEKAIDKNECPIGCVIVKDGRVFVRAHNLRLTKGNAICHAEVTAIDKACRKMGDFRLNDCDMYVTLEPCPMCAGAIIQSRIRKVYFGVLDEKTGAVGSKLNLFTDYKFNHNVDFEDGILSEECKLLLQDFFKDLRKAKLEEKREK